MKRLVLALAIMATAAIAQEATYKFPGWNCRDLAILNQQKALATRDYEKIDMGVLVDLVQNGDPANMATASERVLAVINSVNPECQKTHHILLTKRVGIISKVDKASFEQFCKDNPNNMDLHYVLWGMLDGAKTEYGYQVVSDCLIKYAYSAKYVIRAVDYLNRQAIALDKPDAEVLDLLKKLNRVFSARLIEDKEAWGGVVAQIRTMMETYK